ncbi:MAG TPA: ribosome maturation factor RimP, partial [Candidatus Nanopelagicales bacterium]|nr:ribosome maturation factor RimP [Candidatus Nanopelagicales bacterium]
DPGNRRQAAQVSQPLRALLAPVAADAGLDLEDVEVRAAGRRRLVRVLVDADERVSLDQVAEVSRRISDALDTSDLLGDQPYTLEVSSPGVDRPLTEPRHWRRNAGRLVEVTPAAGAVITGRILSSDEVGVQLDLPTGRESLAYADITRAQVQVEFRRDDAGPPGGES